MAMIKFKATNEALLEIACKAINASHPRGMGIIHYVDKKYFWNDVRRVVSDSGVHIDYFDGRMVKLCIEKPIDCDYYQVIDELDTEYQSFGYKYASMTSLLTEVDGVEIQNEARDV